MLYFIVNKLSGKGKGAEIANIISKAMSEKNIPFSMHETEYHGHAIELSKECSSKDDCQGIVAVGGDGTFSEVLNGLNTAVPMGVITSGSGNDFMRSFAPNKSTLEQLDIVLNGKTDNVDFIQVNDKRSLNVTGTGFDVDILIRERKFHKVLSGSMSYFASLIVTLFTMKFRNFKMVIDEKTNLDQDCLLLALANGKYFGGGLPVSLDSKLNDGILDLTVIRKMPMVKVPFILAKFLKGKISEVTDYVSTYKCKKLECTVSPETDIQLDGELFPISHFVCSIHTNELKMFTE